MQKMNRSLRHYIEQKKPEIKVYKLKKKKKKCISCFDSIYPIPKKGKTNL